jgi:hypothetical protein
MHADASAAAALVYVVSQDQQQQESFDGDLALYSMLEDNACRI